MDLIGIILMLFLIPLECIYSSKKFVFMADYDVIIIGGGAAGICAGIYCVRREMKTLIVEKLGIGGAMLWSEDIDNYPGFGKSTGAEISKKMGDHAKRLGVEFLLEEVKKVDLNGEIKKVKTSSKDLKCKAVIFCTGGSPRKMGVPGEDALRSRGVSYCATCDAPFFKDRIVAVFGGGSTAVEEATYLTKIAKKVMIVHRRDEFRAEESEIKKMEKAGVEKILNAKVKGIKGDKRVTSFVIETPEGEKEIKVDGIFIQIGNMPNSDLARGAGVKVDEKGFIAVDKNQTTNIPGVFAAGDVTGGIEQIVTAVGEGCAAALSAYAYIEKPYWVK
jgi:thioredoxin reductase (NADPH)